MMQAKKYYFLSEAANFIMIFIFYCNLCWVWETVVKLPNSFIMPGGILLFLLFSYAVRTVVKKFVVYMILHAVPTAVIFFFPMDIYSKIFLVVFTVVMISMNIKFWFDTNLQVNGFSYIHFGFVFTSALGYIVADIMNRKFSMFLLFVSGVLFFILFYVRLFADNAYYLYIEKKRNDKMPLKDMLINSAKLAVPFMIVSAVIMLIAKFDFIDQITLDIYFKIAGFIGIVLKISIELLEKLFSFLLGDETETTPPITYTISEEAEGDSLVTNIIAAVVYFMIVAILVFLAIKLIIAVYKAIIFNKERKTYTLEREDVIEIRENIVQRKRQPKVKLSKIRKMYKKLIEKKAKEGYQLYRFHTPRERSEDIKKRMNSDISYINEMYEKERYGQFND